MAKLKLAGADVATRYPVLSAFKAVTTQVVASVAVRDAPETEHPVPVILKKTPPLPEPPAVINVMGVPTVPVMVVLAIVNGA